MFSTVELPLWLLVLILLFGVVDMPEPSMSRLSASGNTVYVTGIRTIYRYHFDATH